ncbi:MAG: molybdopterin-dependent oxidoreductase [Coriobacteriales bacterium]|jgi:molybdopterin guanine dinucleotide-containing S/N-oxide reductase-like protein
MHIKTKDKTVNKSLAWLGSGGGSNACHVDVMDGKIVRIRPIHFDEYWTKEELREWSFHRGDAVFTPGDKTFPPPLSIAYKKRADSPNRIPYPLIRVDFDPHGERNPQNRGKSKYRRISWDEATDICAEEIQRIHDTYGPYSIYCEGDGHGESNSYAGAHGTNIDVFRFRDGCCVQARQPDSWEGWVWGAKHVWGMEPVGSCTQQQNVLKDVTENGDCVLYWGCDLLTAPWGWGGQMTSRLAYFFKDIGIQQIFICPDVNYSCAVHSTKWIPVYPNTDSALQLAIAWVWLTEGTYDKEFLDTHSTGFDWVEYHLHGGDDGIEKTPEWAEGVCGVPAFRIRALAHYWAKHNVSIGHCNGGSMIRAAFSHEPARLEIVLLAMQGLDGPGKHQIKFTDVGTMGDDANAFVPSETSASPLGTYHGWSYGVGKSFVIKTKMPEAIMNGHADWYSQGVFLAPRESQFDHYENPVPDAQPIKMIWSDAPCWSTCWNCGNMDLEALRSPNLEFIMVQHPWMENDTRFADIILPVTTTFECDDVGYDNNNSQYSMYYYERKAIEPYGEARTDYETVMSVFRKLDKPGSIYEGIVSDYTLDMDYMGWMERAHDMSGLDEETSKFTFEDMMSDSAMFWMSPAMEDWEDRPVALQEFVEDPENNPLSTPTGLLEFYSTALAEHFPDDEIRKPYPRWVPESDEHKDRLTSDRAEKYPYLLCSNHPHWRVHAQHDDLPWTREIETCKVKGPDGYAYEPIWVNPVDAEKLDLHGGDIAKLFNERGATLGGIRVTERIMPGVLYQDHGARCDIVVPGMGGLDRGGANNLLSPYATTSENCAGEVTSGYLVGIEKVDVFELAREYPEAFGRMYDPECGQVCAEFIVDDGTGKPADPEEVAKFGKHLSDGPAESVKADSAIKGGE